MNVASYGSHEGKDFQLACMIARERNYVVELAHSYAAERLGGITQRAAAKRIARAVKLGWLRVVQVGSLVTGRGTMYAVTRKFWAALKRLSRMAFRARASALSFCADKGRVHSSVLVIAEGRQDVLGDPKVTEQASYSNDDLLFPKVSEFGARKLEALPNVCPWCARPGALKFKHEDGTPFGACKTCRHLLNGVDHNVSWSSDAQWHFYHRRPYEGCTMRAEMFSARAAQCRAMLADTDDERGYWTAIYIDAKSRTRRDADAAVGFAGGEPELEDNGYTELAEQDREYVYSMSLASHNAQVVSLGFAMIGFG